MDAFVGQTVTLESAIGRLTLGVVDPFAAGVAAAISRLLTRSIQDARATRGGHLPDWLVAEIERRYTSAESVQTLWARTGHRFCVALDGEIVATIHVAREHDTILTLDRARVNVSSRDYPDAKPARHHQVVNISVAHALRRARIGTAMLDAIVAHFRDRFDGDGLWVRADPPWHAGLVGLGFVHDPSRDVFLPSDAERTADLPHAELNRRYACECAPPAPHDPDALAERPRAMRERKLQYLSFTRAFDGVERLARVARSRAPIAADAATLERFARDWGLVHRVRPTEVATPTHVDQVEALLVRATRETTPVVVRGQGHSAAGRALGSGLVLCTAGLDRIVAIGDDSVTVEAGVRWQTLVRALSGDRYPPVLTGWLGATIGGTLSTGGYSKGSHRHGLQIDHVISLVVVTGDGRRVECSAEHAAWLFDAVRGGGGRFGVIVEATLPLVPQPRFLRVASVNVGAAPEALLLTLDAAAADPSSYHVTAFRDGMAWTVVCASAAHDTAGASTFAGYVDPPRPSEPPGPARWLHVFLSREAVAPYLDAMAPWLGEGDALQACPIGGAGRAMRYAVGLTRELRDRDDALIAAQNAALLETARRLGGIEHPHGDVGRLGASASARAKRVADPAGILGAISPSA